MKNPTAPSAHALRAMLGFIAKDLGIDDQMGEKNAVTLTREIRIKIANLRPAINPLDVATSSKALDGIE